MHANMVKFFKIIALSICMSVPSIAWSNTVEETPSALAMTGDALFVRPVMLVTTIIGGGIFLVSSPFSASGGNIGEAFDTLVKEPFNTTFVRCLGCTQNGRKFSETVEQEPK